MIEPLKGRVKFHILLKKAYMETSVYIAGPGDIEHIARALNVTGAARWAAWSLTMR